MNCIPYELESNLSIGKFFLLYCSKRFLRKQPACSSRFDQASSMTGKSTSSLLGDNISMIIYSLFPEALIFHLKFRVGQMEK